MQPRINIAIKACRSVADIITSLYKSRNHDDLNNMEDIRPFIFKKIIEIIEESYPFGKEDFIGYTNLEKNLIGTTHEILSLDETLGNKEKINWVINPIDSLDNFRAKIPLYNITIALIKDGSVVGAIIYNPNLDEFITSIKGQGALIENKKIRNKKQPKDQLLYSINNDESNLKLKRLINGKTRNMGSPSVDLVYLAQGLLDLVVQNDLDITELAAGVLVCQESGVMVSDFNGDDKYFYTKNIIAASPYEHKKVLKLIS